MSHSYTDTGTPHYNGLPYGNRPCNQMFSLCHICISLPTPKLCTKKKAITQPKQTKSPPPQLPSLWRDVHVGRIESEPGPEPHLPSTLWRIRTGTILAFKLHPNNPGMANTYQGTQRFHINQSIGHQSWKNTDLPTSTSSSMEPTRPAVFSF